MKRNFRIFGAPKFVQPIDVKTEQKNNENVFVWIDPKVNESAKNNATLM